MTFNPVSSPAISGTTTSGVVPTTTSSGDAPALNAVKNPSLTPVPEGELGIPSGDVPSITPQSNASSGPSALNSTPAAQGPQQPAGGHPHLKDNLQEPIRKMFHDDTPQVAKGSENATQQMLEKLGDRLKPDGSFDLKGLKAADGTEITAKMLKKAHLSVKITGDDGKFDYKFSGHCNEEAAKCLEALERVLNAVDQEVNGGSNNKFNLMANIVRGGGSTPSDADVLGRGGQIHYKLQGDDIVKLTLDPGEHGENDGLSVQCLNEDGTPKLDDDGAPILQKIPLKVVFEGAEHDGVRAFGDNGRPFLPDWRSSKIFEASQMHVQTEYWTKKEVSSNINDGNRIQAENRLWNAAYEYLKLMVSKNTSDGNIPTFDISGDGNTEPTEKGIDTLLSSPDFSKVELNHIPAVTTNTMNMNSSEPLIFPSFDDTNLTYSHITVSGDDNVNLKDDTLAALGDLQNTLASILRSNPTASSEITDASNLLFKRLEDLQPTLATITIPGNLKDDTLARLGNLQDAINNLTSILQTNPITSGKITDDLKLLLKPLEDFQPALGGLVTITARSDDNGNQKDTLDALKNLQDAINNLLSVLRSNLTDAQNRTNNDQVPSIINTNTELPVNSVPTPPTDTVGSYEQISPTDDVNNSGQTTPVNAVSDSEQTTDSSFEDIIKALVDARQKRRNSSLKDEGFNDENALMDRLIPLMDQEGFDNHVDTVLKKLKEDGKFSNSAGEERIGGIGSRNDIKERLEEIKRMVQEARELHKTLESPTNSSGISIQQTNFKSAHENKPGYNYIINEIIYKDLPEGKNNFTRAVQNKL